MKVCPITYEKIEDGETYSRKGLSKLSPSLKKLNEFPLTQAEQCREAANLAGRMSIQGVQPKLSVRLNIKEETFEIVPVGGRYILKPEHIYQESPANEDLSMRLASTVGIEVPFHGLIYSKGSSFTYFIKRFDRFGQKGKRRVEDFAQLSDKTRETKYDSSMERLINIIDEFCAFPVVEKVELFKRTLFNFLIGNDDMHLKNYSMIERDNKVELSPAYDLINSTIFSENSREEIALPLNGKKNNIKSSDLIDYYGRIKLGINEPVMNKIINEFKKSFSPWRDTIRKSFLSEEMKIKYTDVIENRISRLTL